MRLINAKYQVTELNIRTIIKFFRVLYKNISPIRFEIIETNKTYQFKFYILKSHLTSVERYWIKSKIKKYIKHDEDA